jgi:hypothetical protein
MKSPIVTLGVREYVDGISSDTARSMCDSTNAGSTNSLWFFILFSGAE